VVLLYQGWTYWIFRKRLSRSDLEPPAGRGGEAVAQPAAGPGPSPMPQAQP
jgi:cytochrome bd ubiquinol oxidase subunit II